MSTLDHKERIVQAAYTIGARGGLAAISARAVAEDAGVSVGYLYKVFPLQERHHGRRRATLL